MLQPPGTAVPTSQPIDIILGLFDCCFDFGKKERNIVEERTPVVPLAVPYAIIVSDMDVMFIALNFICLCLLRRSKMLFEFWYCYLQGKSEG